MSCLNSVHELEDVFVLTRDDNANRLTDLSQLVAQGDKIQGAVC